MEFEKIIIVTRKTWLDELIEQFNTKSQAKFYIQHMGGNFEEYQEAHSNYYDSLEMLKKQIPSKTKFQIIERSFLPSFLFNPTDLVVVIGQDGLVINTAKYLNKQEILAINPDPSRIEGVFTQFTAKEFSPILNKIEENEEKLVQVTMAKVELNDGQKIYGVNDLFIGHQSHQSARYRITHKGVTEMQSSSGIIISTGAGSTGWYKSILFGSFGITNIKKQGLLSIPEESEYKFPWNAEYLQYCVREPWKSLRTGVSRIFGTITAQNELIVEYNMPENGVIFSDGIEKDYLKFNSGTTARISVAEKKAHLISRLE